MGRLEWSTSAASCAGTMEASRDASPFHPDVDESDEPLADPSESTSAGASAFFEQPATETTKRTATAVRRIMRALSPGAAPAASRAEYVRARRRYPAAQNDLCIAAKGSHRFGECPACGFHQARSKRGGDAETYMGPHTSSNNCKTW